MPEQEQAPEGSISPELPDIDLRKEISGDLESYNTATKEAEKNIKNGIKQLGDVLDKTKTNYNTLIASDRTKNGMVAAETAKAISSLVKETVSLNLAVVNLAQKRLESNVRTRTILKSLEIQEKTEKDEKNGTGDGNFNPTMLLEQTDKFFQAFGNKTEEVIDGSEHNR